MVNINICNNGNYKYLVDKFSENKIKSRYIFLCSFISDYIIQKGYQDKVILSTDILDHIIVDYFVDIDRLKPFQEIEYVNETKIYSYLSFWILRHKPIQVIASEKASELVYVNEDLVSELIASFLLSQPEDVPVIEEKQEAVYEFLKTMKYNFCYRSFSAQSIELMIMAFNAGRGYQYSVDYLK